MGNTNAIRLLALLLWTVLLANEGNAQILHITAAINDSIRAIDTTNWAVVQQTRVTLAGNTVTGLNGIAFDPVFHDVYCLVKTTAQPGAAILATIHLGTGVCTQVGSLGAPFTAISFREDGQLLGVVGDAGGVNAEKLFLIDKTNAATSLAVALGNGDDGEVISFNTDDGMLYHWSGNSTMILEKLPATAPYSPLTNVPTSGVPGGEITAATYLGGGKFLVSNANANLLQVSASGQYGLNLTTISSVPSGLVMAPRFSLSDDFFCVFDTISWNFGGMAPDTAVYDWGDGNIESVFPASSAAHSYTVPGNYTTKAYLKNPVSGLDLMASTNIQVKPLPPVSLNPGRDTVLCLSDTLMITGSFGGTSQWFRNGQTIPGANTNVYFATNNGWYNMTKRNQNGCIDSAATGIAVIFGSQAPSPAISFDTSGCPTVIFQSNDPFGTQWNWSFGDGATGTSANPTHTYASIGSYNVSVTADNGCHVTTATSTVVIDCFIGREMPFATGIRLAPNPSNGRFRMAVNLPEAMALHYRIVDMRGIPILEAMHDAVEGEWSEDISLQAAPGIYHLIVGAGESLATFRIVVQ